MKKFLFSSLLAVALIAITFVGCQRIGLESAVEAPLPNSKSSTSNNEDAVIKQITAYFPQIEAIKLNKGEVVFFDVIWDKTTNKISIGNIKIENGAFIAFGSFAGENSTEKKYTVSCDNAGTSNDWTSTCDGTYACGQLIKKCLDEGGCSTICSNRVLYVPANFEVVE